jgi:hypothetical protein
MQKVNSILLSLEFFCNPIQLLTVEISSNGAAIWNNFPMNNPFDSPSNVQPLVPVRVVNVQHQLLIAGKKIAEPFVVMVRCH